MDLAKVRLREHGSELIEVCDNGSGISPDDYESVARRHHTSKIKAFSDVQVSQYSESNAPNGTLHKEVASFAVYAFFPVAEGMT